MTHHPTHRLRVPLHDYEAAAAWALVHPARALWLRALAYRDARGATELVVREVLHAPEGAGAVAPPGHFLLQWVARPVTAAARCLARLCQSGAAGGVFLPLPGLPHPAFGVVCRDHGAGVEWLESLHLAGPGLCRIEMNRVVNTHGVIPGAARPRAAWRRLAAARVAVAGASQAVSVANALLDHGVRCEMLAQDTLGLDQVAGEVTQGLGPASIGQTDGVMADDRLARRGGGATVALAREDARLHDMLSSLQPEIVIGCHPDPVRRAALAAWCAERQRVWIDIATLQPQAPPGASAGATLRVLLPTLHGPADGTGAAPPSSRELFDDLPLPGPYVPHTALRLATLSTYLTLQRHVARAAVNVVMELLRGRAPPAIRISVQTAPAGRPQRCIVEELESDGDGDDYMPWAGTPAADARASAAH